MEDLRKNGPGTDGRFHAACPMAPTVGPMERELSRQATPLAKGKVRHEPGPDEPGIRDRGQPRRPRRRTIENQQHPLSKSTGNKKNTRNKGKTASKDKTGSKKTSNDDDNRKKANRSVTKETKSKEKAKSKTETLKRTRWGQAGQVQLTSDTP